MAEAPRDYYEVLGIPRDADASAIKDAFRQLAMKYHPDRNKSPDAEERFKEIAEAYAILSDPKKRSEYDTRGHAGVAGFSAEDLFSGIDFGDIFGNHFADFGFGSGDGLFDRLFRQRQGPSRGRDLEVRLMVPLERIFKGGEEVVRFSRTAPCPACHGSGAEPGTQPRQCDACKGTGRKVLSQRDDGGMHFEQVTTCPVCHGSGTIIDTPCNHCHGLGRVEKEEILLERAGLGNERAVRAERRAAAVEHEIVVSTDLVDVDERDTMSGHLPAKQFDSKILLSHDEGRGGDVDQQFGAGLYEGLDRVGTVDAPPTELFIVPEVLADREANGDLPPTQRQTCDGDFISRLEVTEFVEDIVGREQMLGVRGDDAAMCADGRRVAERSTRARLVRLHKPDNRDGVLTCRSYTLDGGYVLADEMSLQEKVAGRVTEDGQLRKDDEFG